METAAGALLAAASIWSLVRGLRAGAVHGRVNDFRRETSPVSFWLTIAATGLAAALGIALLVVGSGRFQ
jgi:hypothetical protein